MRLIRFLLVLLGVIALLIAGVALAAEIMSLVVNGKVFAKPLGQVWREFDKDSLLLLQPAVERYLHPWLWWNILFPLQLQPPIAAAGAFGILGLVLVGLGRLGRRRA